VAVVVRSVVVVVVAVVVVGAVVVVVVCRGNGCRGFSATRGLATAWLWYENVKLVGVVRIGARGLGPIS
jgi:hypothetical protein